MSSPKKIGRWNRFEIAFNKGMRSEAEACQRDWREKQGKARGMGGWGRQDEPTPAQNGEEKPTLAQTGRAESSPAQNGEEKPTSAQTGRAESTLAQNGEEKPTLAQTGRAEPTSAQTGRAESSPAQNGEEKPTSEQTGRAEPTSARRRFEQETFAETSPSEKRTSTVVRSVGEEARRSKIDAEAKKNVDSTLKLERLDKSEGLKKLEKAKKPTSKRDFPFGKPRARTFRSSAAPRRFDRLRRDQEEDRQN